jgi:hypothetical protein
VDPRQPLKRWILGKYILILSFVLWVVEHTKTIVVD